ncbi:hypothetical protein As57867_001915, partial [Aphanomyces stellatus]
DLSGHDLQSIASVPPEQWPRLTTLNLSHNVLMSVDDVLKNLPPTIEVLDLSFNRITAIENVRWDIAFPRLTTLLLNGNNISTLKNATFPLSLQTLDLSDNPLFSVEMSRATFNQLSSSMNVTMHTLRQMGTGLFKSMCPEGELSYIKTNAVCVVEPPSASNPFSRFAKSYGLIVLLTMCIVGLYLLPRQPQEERGLRGTFLSSGDEVMSPMSMFGSMNSPTTPPCP